MHYVSFINQEVTELPLNVSDNVWSLMLVLMRLSIMQVRLESVLYLIVNSNKAYNLASNLVSIALVPCEFRRTNLYPRSCNHKRI